MVSMRTTPFLCPSQCSQHRVIGMRRPPLSSQFPLNADHLHRGFTKMWQSEKMQTCTRTSQPPLFSSLNSVNPISLLPNPKRKRQRTKICIFEATATVGRRMSVAVLSGQRIPAPWIRKNLCDHILLNRRRGIDPSKHPG